MDDVILSLDEITPEEGRGLVKLARMAIQEYLTKGIKIDLVEVPYESWKKKGASFVTIEKSPTHQLRGCIGSIIPHQPLYKDVIDNAISAATSDPRFPPLTPEELDDVIIKVSILSFPQPLEYKDPYDLLEKITPFRDGLIIKYGNHQATFLPDVWEELPDKKLFLSHLCQKAGLPADCWLTLPIQVFVYHTKVFSEED
ncbi:MAG: AmmeMemoRadiSam system protein A [Aquificae bacterium]|nr:AmmeMemoRadiSam system protein A [Aquificota bacterium]